MKCAACGTDNSPEVRFCVSCGVPLDTGGESIGPVIYCTSCGTENPSEASFCTSCGAQMHAPQAPTAIPPSTKSVEAKVEYAGFWLRFVANVIDAVIVFVVGILLIIIAGGPGLILAWLGFFLYYVLFIGLKGQTPGKMAMGIQVVTSGGEVPGVGWAFIREIIGKFISSLVIFLGFIWVVFDSRKQGWHDKLARTYVVKKR